MTDTTRQPGPDSPPLADCGFFTWFADIFSIRSWRLRRRLAQLHRPRIELERELIRRVTTQMGTSRREK